MFSIYTSLYRLQNGFIDWKDALNNFELFADEVCVSTISDSNDSEILNEYSKSHPKIKVITTDFSLDSYDFDGKLKNAALKSCTRPFCILLDGDERIRINERQSWISLANYLNNTEYDAFFIPVIDLFNTEREYKSIGQKWYLHKNLNHLHRGIVNFARIDSDKIDINKSDTCELINDNGDLCNALSFLRSLTVQEVNFFGIKIFHLGWLIKEKRLLANHFWSNVWSNRAGYKVNNIIETKEELEKIEYWPHKLKLWHE